MKKKIIIGFVVIIILGAITGGIIYKNKIVGSFSGGKPMEVKVADVKVGNMNATISVNGIIEESEKSEMFIDSSVKVKEVYVEKDQYVKKGQKMFLFDMDTLNSQLNQTRVNLNIQNNNLQKIKDLLKLQNTEQAQKSLSQASTNLEQAQTNYDRVQKLYNGGAASLIEVENAKTQYNNAKYQYDISKSNLDDLNKNNNDLTSSNQIDIKNQIEQIKLTELSIQDLESKINKLNAQSVSPIDGVITELNLQKGSITSPAMSAAKIIDPNQLNVKLKVKEMDILNVKVGQKLEITGDALGETKINGLVDSIGTMALKANTLNSSDDAFVEVIAKVEDSQNILRPGLSVTADIITQSKTKVVMTSFDTIQEDKDGNKWVFTMNGNIAKQVAIETGISSGLNLEVTKGLHGNEKVIKDPPSRLKDGSIISIIDENAK